MDYCGELKVLDLGQLRVACQGNSQLMSELISLLVSDSLEQLSTLEAAVQRGDTRECLRVAHYLKSACAAAGAQALAAALEDFEASAKAADLPTCRNDISVLRRELNRLSVEAGSF